jgi:hypothetical protein
MRNSFNFFQNKLKSVDNFKSKRKVSKDYNMLNNFQNSFRPENKLKKKPLIDKEISALPNNKKIDSITKPMNDSLNRLSSIKKNSKKRPIECLLLDQQKRKSIQNPSFYLKIPSFKKSNKKVHYSSKNGSLNFSNLNVDNNELLRAMNSFKEKKKGFLESKKPRNEFFNNKMGKTPKNIRLNNNVYKNYIKDYFRTFGNKRSESSKAIENRFNYYNNHAKIYQMNQKIQNEIESRELKKKSI